MDGSVNLSATNLILVIDDDPMILQLLQGELSMG